MAASKFDGIWKLMLKHRFVMPVDSSDSDLTCLICKKLMVDACVSTCGCQYCYKCIDTYLIGGDKYCPGAKGECNEEFLVMNQHILKNRALNNRICELKIKCPNNGCHSKAALKDMEAHLQECIVSQNLCPYTVMGCEGVVRDRDSIPIHLQSDVLTHTQLLVEHITQLDSKFNALQDNFEISKAEVSTLREELRKKDIQIHSMEAQITSLATLRRETLNVKSNMDALRAQSQRYRTEVDAKLLMMKSQLSQMESHPPTSRVEPPVCEAGEPSVKIGNGMAFTINEFSTRKNVKTELFSPYFYSHTNGYKLRLRIWPGGYAGRDGFLSVHFIIGKGEYDDQLEWPFTHSIDISILNQRNAQLHATRKYELANFQNIGGDTFKKPNEKDNNSCGQSTFISHKDLESIDGLIVNDSVIIKCDVTAPI